MQEIMLIMCADVLFCNFLFHQNTEVQNHHYILNCMLSECLAIKKYFSCASKSCSQRERKDNVEQESFPLVYTT